MIGLILMAAGSLAFLRQLWLLSQYKNYQGRRGLTGCEISRQLLDLMGFSQMMVQRAAGWERFRAVPMKQIFLEPAVYEGSGLRAVAEAVRQTVLMTRVPESVLPFDWSLRTRNWLRYLILPAWILLLLGILQPAWGFLKFSGLMILDFSLLLGVLELPREWEASREAYELLKRTEQFEPDELVKLRHLLEAGRFDGITEIFRVPVEIVSGVMEKRGNHGV